MIRRAVAVENTAWATRAAAQVRLGPQRPDLRPLVEHHILVIAADGDVPDPVQQRRLVLEGRVDQSPAETPAAWAISAIVVRP